MDKSRAMRLLSEVGAFSAPIVWPEGATGLMLYGGDELVHISREEVEAGRKIEYWSETLKSPDVIVQVEPEAGL